jgi:hypothetical protein
LRYFGECGMRDDGSPVCYLKPRLRSSVRWPSGFTIQMFTRSHSIHSEI